LVDTIGSWNWPSEERGPNASMAITQPKTTTTSGVRQETDEDDAGPATDMSAS
jgi:hypothetical protein